MVHNVCVSEERVVEVFVCVCINNERKEGRKFSVLHASKRPGMRRERERERGREGGGKRNGRGRQNTTYNVLYFNY
jgi:hypothetical protein